MTNILIIDAHPDPDPGHFVHALADAYAQGAQDEHVRLVKLSEMEIPVLHRPDEWLHSKPPAQIGEAQEAIAWAEHLVIFYPLWLGDVPALLKAFLEQVMRPGFAFRYSENGRPEKLLKGRSAHIVVTMGMPAIFYRLVYGAHSVKSLKRNVLAFVGIRPVFCTILGGVEASAEKRAEWLALMRALDEAAQ